LFTFLAAAIMLQPGIEQTFVRWRRN